MAVEFEKRRFETDSAGERLGRGVDRERKKDDKREEPAHGIVGERGRKKN